MSENLPLPAAVNAARVRTIHGDLWLHADDQVMLPYLRSSGVWEPSEERLLSSLFRPTTRFLDVGANVGYFSVVASKLAPRGSIDAVEPLPANLALLRMNLFMHAAAARIWPLALGSGRDVLPLRFEARNYGDARLGSASAQSGLSPAASILAPVVAADDLFANQQFDLVKIDVQGYELEVLRGMRRILRTAIVVAEFFPNAIEDRGLDPAAVLAGYRELGLEWSAAVESRLERLDDRQLIGLCRNAGPNGYVNLVLRSNERNS